MGAWRKVAEIIEVLFECSLNGSVQIRWEVQFLPVAFEGLLEVVCDRDRCLFHGGTVHHHA